MNKYMIINNIYCILPHGEMVAPSETPASALGLEPDTFPDLQDGDLDK
jgi:hypothetical protein